VLRWDCLGETFWENLSNGKKSRGLSLQGLFLFSRYKHLLLWKGGMRNVTIWPIVTSTDDCGGNHYHCPRIGRWCGYCRVRGSDNVCADSGMHYQTPHTEKEKIK
jgi:hypothetical protein